VHGWPGVARRTCLRCDEIQPPKQPNPLTLLSVARSPSRTHRCVRWWAFTPPFHPWPACAGGSALCCGCSHAANTSIVADANASTAPSLAVS
jgi:hypothetical protein